MDSKADGDRFTRFTRPTDINLLERCVELSTLLCGGARTHGPFSQPIDFSCGCDPVHATRTGAVRARGWVLLQSLFADSKLQADPSFWTESPIEKEEREIILFTPHGVLLKVKEWGKGAPTLSSRERSRSVLLFSLIEF